MSGSQFRGQLPQQRFDFSELVYRSYFHGNIMTDLSCVPGAVLSPAHS